MAQLPDTAEQTIRFGDFVLDPAQATLLHQGRRLKLQPQPFRVLEYLLRRAPGLVTREELGDHVWGTDVYVDLDQSLNYCIRQIRQVLGDDATNPRFVETLPRQGYRFIGLIDPIVPIAAAPSTHSKPIAPQFDQPQTLTAHSRPRSTAIVSAVALTCLLALAAFFVYRHHAASRTAIQSIAVLPLNNLSGDPNQEYFADGLTDEIITMLARNSSLKVTSRTSVMQYKDARRSLPDIARELGVEAILEGSITRNDDKIHINLQLIQAASDKHLWAESYDRNDKDISAFPLQAASQIARLTSTLTAGPHLQIAILPEAHDAYLRGRYLWFGNNNLKAGEAFRKSIELQPDYSQAWSGLAMNYAAGAIKGIFDPAQSLEPAEVAARRAIALDDSSPEAHLALGSTLFISRRTPAAALAEVNHAIELDPRFAEAYHFRSIALAAIGRYKESLDSQQTSSELDPFARPWAMTRALLRARDYDAALVEAKSRLESNPTDSRLYFNLSEVYIAKGMKLEAVQALQKNAQLHDPEDLQGFQKANSSGGFDSVLRWQLELLTKRKSTQYVSPIQFARLHAQLHERDQTLRLLEEGARTHSPEILWIESDAAYDFLHNDPRYKAIVQHLFTAS